MKWGVRKDDRKGTFNPSKGEGLNSRQQRLYEKSNQAYSEHRAAANSLAKKMDSKTYQREDVQRFEKAGKKDVRAAERYAKATGQFSKDAKANVRSRKINKGARVVNSVLSIGGSIGGTAALILGQPVAAIAIGAGTGLATLGTSAVANKAAHTNVSTINQYYNDISKANDTRKPIEAMKRIYG